MNGVVPPNTWVPSPPCAPPDWIELGPQPLPGETVIVQQKILSLYYVAAAGQVVFSLSTPDIYGNTYQMNSTTALAVTRNGSRLTPDDGSGVGGYTVGGNQIMLLWPAGVGELVIVDLFWQPDSSDGGGGGGGGSGPAGPQGPAGPAGATGSRGPPGPSAVSANAGNYASLGTDSLIYVPTPSTAYLPSSGGTLTGGIVVQGPADLKVQTVIQSGASLSINRALGENCALSLTASVTSMTVSNWPASGTTGKARLVIANTGAFNITGWPTGTIWPSGVAPTITSGSGKKDIILLMSDDGGVTVFGSVVGQDYH